MKKFPDAKVVYSGGETKVYTKKELSGIDVAKMFFKRMEVDIDKIFFEGQSKNTYENFIFSKKFINNANGENWLLVTSAAHMKRAMSVAEKLGLSFIPYPVDFKKPGDGISPSEFNQLVGSVVKRRLNANQKISWDDIS